MSSAGIGPNLDALSRLCGSQGRIQFMTLGVSLLLPLAAGYFSITTGGAGVPLAAAGKRSLNHVVKREEVCEQSLECLMKRMYKEAVGLML